eukprot:m.212192 g.212192  ORF g.212192 m.212192 type:complete len:642 (-) comp22145_c0_seq5:302-2227(-)
MEASMIKRLDQELQSVEPKVSQRKIATVAKIAMDAYKYYKRVVHSVEKFIYKASPECKLPGLYVMDGILKESRKHHGAKDVYAPRFAKNLSSTYQYLMRCGSDDQEKIQKVMTLWKEKGIFPAEVLDNVLANSRDPEATPGVVLDDFDYGDDEDDAERLALNTKRRQEEERKVESERPASPPPLTMAEATSAAPQSVDIALSILQMIGQVPASTSPATNATSAAAVADDPAPSDSPNGGAHQSWAGDPYAAGAAGPHGAGGWPAHGHQAGAHAWPGGPRPPRGRGFTPQARPPCRPGFIRIYSTTVWLGNLPHKIRREQLESVAATFGEFNMAARQLDEVKRCAFLSYRTRYQAEDARKGFFEFDFRKEYPDMQEHIKVGWARGLGQKDYREGWEHVDGSIEIPLATLTPENLHEFNVGCTIDRANIPPDLERDLEAIDASYFSSVASKEEGVARNEAIRQRSLERKAAAADRPSSPAVVESRRPYPGDSRFRSSRSSRSRDPGSRSPLSEDYHRPRSHRPDTFREPFHGTKGGASPRDSDRYDHHPRHSHHPPYEARNGSREWSHPPRDYDSRAAHAPLPPPPPRPDVPPPPLPASTDPRMMPVNLLPLAPSSVASKMQEKEDPAVSADGNASKRSRWDQ